MQPCSRPTAGRQPEKLLDVPPYELNMPLAQLDQQNPPPTKQDVELHVGAAGCMGLAAGCTGSCKTIVV